MLELRTSSWKMGRYVSAEAEKAQLKAVHGATAIVALTRYD